MLVGFILAAYSIVANDAIQTLGTFLSSNSRRPWWVLWIYACLILLAVLVYGWLTNEGDIAYGRLEQFRSPREHYLAARHSSGVHSFVDPVRCAGQHHVPGVDRLRPDEFAEDPDQIAAGLRRRHRGSVSSST